MSLPCVAAVESIYRGLHLSALERLTRAQNKRDEGNEQFRLGEYVYGDSRAVVS